MSDHKSRVFIRNINEMPFPDIITYIFKHSINTDDSLGGKSVLIKPNLCHVDKNMVRHANTNYDLIYETVKYLKTFTDDISIGESDGTRYEAEQAFEATNLYKLASEFNIKLINFSKDDKKSIAHPLVQSIEMPQSLLNADIVINLPVLKTHALTVFTGAVKNQWGCVPRYDRIIWHQFLDELLSDLIGIIKPSLAVMDTVDCMEGRGPTNGKPRKLDLLIASTDMVALDTTAMRLVGLNPYTSNHIVLSNKKGHGNIDKNFITIDGDFERFKCTFEPAVNDWAIRAMNYLTRYPFFTYKILLNNKIFCLGKRAVNILRDIGVVR